MAAPLLTRMAQKLHRRSLTKWATKPTKGLERGLTNSLQWKEENKEVVLRLTGVGEEEEAGTPCSGLHAAPNWAQTKRLSQPYKNPKVRGSYGEQTEREKREEEEGFEPSSSPSFFSSVCSPLESLTLGLL